MHLPFRTLTPRLEKCIRCKRGYSRTVGDFYNPLEYFQFMCCDCNSFYLDKLLSNGACILNHACVQKLFK